MYMQIKERTSDIGMGDNVLDVEAIRIYNKQLPKMTKAELKIEQAAFMWLAVKIEDWVRMNSMRLYHLRENYPVDEDTREKVLEDYENGLITLAERRNRSRKITMREREHEKVEARLILGQRAADHFRAMGVALGEEIDYRISYEKYNPKRKGMQMARKKKRRSAYDPRKNQSKYNLAPWRTELPPKTTDKKKLRPKPKVSNIHKKWKKSTMFDYRFSKMQCIAECPPTFSLESLRRIGYDRGYMTNLTLEAAIAESVGITIGAARTMLYLGNVRWEVSFIIADLLEMTPAEYCDTFLHGLFRETVQGKWTAVLPDFYNPPKEDAETSEEPKESRQPDDSAFETAEEEEEPLEDEDFDDDDDTEE